MKQYIHNFVMTVFAAAILVACKEKEPPPDHPIVGIWSLESVTIKNLPAGYQSYEGALFSAREWLEDGVDETTEEEYKYEFLNDNTYKSTYLVTGPNIIENGSWIIEENILTLTPDEDPYDVEYTIIGDIGELEMTLAKADNYTLFSEEFIAHEDTLTSYTFEGPDDNNNQIPDRWEELQEKYTAPVDLTLWFTFDR